MLSPELQAKAAEIAAITMESLNFGTLTPMLILIVGALVILTIDLIKPHQHKSLYTMISIVFIALGFGATVGFNGGARGFFDVMLVDGVSILSQAVILIASALFIPLALTSKRFHEYSMPEYFALFLFMIAGFQFMVSTDNLILIFVALETASLALYAMIAMHNRDQSFEAAIKYFTMGALAAGFYAFGALILYAITGSVEIAQIAAVLEANNFEPMGAVLVAFVFIIVTFGFKLSMVPFHTWTPDVYEGSSAALAGYMSIVPKLAGFVVALRIFDVLVSADIIWVEYILYAIVVITMTLSNIMALVQTDVKRMLAFSSISHAGFVLAAILIATPKAHTALFLYWILFLFTNLGSFAMLWVSRHKSKRWDARFDNPYSKFNGMIKVMPFAAVVMAIFMFSLAGVPPFSLFWGKLYMMGAAVDAGYIVLALIMAANSAISAYYYLKLVVHMFLHDPIESDGTVYMKNASVSLKSIIGFSAFLTLMAIFLVNPLIQIINEYLKASGY
jgi:NADH-quinone oxidoreductase subunit N